MRGVKRVVLIGCQIILWIFPWKARCWVYTRIFGFELGKGAYIGRSVIICPLVILGQNARIGEFNIIRNLDSLSLECDALIGSFNWIFGYRGPTGKFFKHRTGRRSVLHLKRGAAVVSRHILDCTDSITIGEFTILAGYRSQLLTHSIDLEESRQDCEPIVVGDRCFIGTGVIVLKGACVPDRSVVGAGSVFGLKTEIREGGLYMGIPAYRVAELPETYQFFRRSSAFVE